MYGCTYTYNKLVTDQKTQGDEEKTGGTKYWMYGTLKKPDTFMKPFESYVKVRSGYQNLSLRRMTLVC